MIWCAHMQAMADKLVQEWYFWAGGSAAACLQRASQGLRALEEWKDHITSILSKTTMEDLLVRFCACSLLAPARALFCLLSSELYNSM